MAKKSIFTRIQHGIESVKGQKVMNYLYSWGAAVVILGALCKLTHLPLANFWLFLGMGTEVAVFIVSGFDTSGIDVEKAKRLEARRRAKEEAEEAGVAVDEVPQVTQHEGGAALDADTVAALAAAAANGVQGGGGAPVIIGGGAPVGGATIVGGGAAVSGGAPVAAVAEGAPVAGASGPIVIGGGGVAAVPPIPPTETEKYVETLVELTDTLAKVNEQAARLTRDSEEMQNLGRTLTSINVIYEQQLKQVSAQMGSMDEINLQTQQMAQHIAALNDLYARMIQAMTVNLSKQ